MKGYTQNEVIPAQLVGDFYEATSYVERFPDRDQHGKLVRCHEVARAVLKMLGTDTRRSVVDGHYGPVAFVGHPEHSWIEIRQPAEEWHRHDFKVRAIAILDTYVMGALPQCQLVMAGSPTSHFGLYRPGPVRTDIQDDVVDWLIEKANWRDMHR